MGNMRSRIRFDMEKPLRWERFYFTQSARKNSRSSEDMINFLKNLLKLQFLHF